MAKALLKTLAETLAETPTKTQDAYDRSQEALGQMWKTSVITACVSS